MRAAGKTTAVIGEAIGVAMMTGREIPVLAPDESAAATFLSRVKAHPLWPFISARLDGDTILIQAREDTPQSS